jgi:type IV secretory pathway TraG/TraD family ATPase VirD4
MSLGKPQSGGGEQRFFELASQQITRVAIHLIKLAGEPLSIPNISRAISSFPTYLGEQETEAWQRHSYTYSLIESIRKRKETLTEEEWQNLEAASAFVFERWAQLDERPRSSIAMTFSGLADRFLYNPTKKLFAGGTYSFTPEQVTHEKKLIILDFPVLEFGKEGARLIQSMIKLTFQRAWLRHPYTPGCCNGAALVQDEFQLLITKFENHFAQTCRGSGIAPIYITQNILNLAEELGESQPGSKTKAFLGNLGTKIAHRTTCVDTCAYLSSILGKEYRYLDNYSGGSSSGSNHTQFSAGGSRQLVNVLDESEFTRLARPGTDSPYAAAIVYCGGETFNATRTANCPQGRNFLRVMFSRE